MCFWDFCGLRKWLYLSKWEDLDHWFGRFGPSWTMNICVCIFKQTLDDTSFLWFWEKYQRNILLQISRTSAIHPCPPILSILTQWQTFKFYGPYQYFLENIQLMVRPGGLGPWNLPIYHETLPETKSPSMKNSTCWRWLFIWVSAYFQGRIIVRFKGPGSWNIWNPLLAESRRCLHPAARISTMVACNPSTRLSARRWTNDMTDTNSDRRRIMEKKKWILGPKIQKNGKKQYQNTLGISKLKKVLPKDLFSLPASMMMAIEPGYYAAMRSFSNCALSKASPGHDLNPTLNRSLTPKP